MNPPDLPPPLPPTPVPAVPRKGFGTGAIVLIVVGAVVLPIAVLGALAVPAFQSIQKLAQEEKQKRAKAAQVVKPLTAEQKVALQAFGDELAEALADEDDEKVKSMLDSAALAERVFDDRLSGVPQVADVKRGFFSGITKNPGGWLHDLMGADIKVLRLHEREGLPAVLLRIKPEGGGVNYVDILVRPEGSTFRAVDMFTYMYASLVSDEARNMMAMMLPDSAAGKLAALLGISQTDTEMVGHLKSAGDLLRAGKYKEALRVCDALPAKYRTNRRFFMMRLQAHMALSGTDDDKNDAAYKEVLRAAPDILGKDSTTDLIMIDLFFLDNQLAEADACIQRVQKVIGNDPYLKVLRANTRRMMKDYAGALKLAHEAQQEEPGLYEAVDARLSIRADQKDFAGLLEELRAFKKTSGVTLTRDTMAEDAQFAEFLASPEFATWEKENPAK
ncbi:MAG: hypothetical protein IAE77_13770 [Prosthecobacter sp.]|jgi:hypothetical protein|nr:hypothetical protein [Prosthecobacter sp.]